MKKLLSVIALAFLLSGYVYADSSTLRHTPQETEAAGSHTDAGEANLESHGHYVNKDGNTVHSPSKSKLDTTPPGASAQCRDGSYSFSQHRRGTCSHHGGVATWF